MRRRLTLRVRVAVLACSAWLPLGGAVVSAGSLTSDSLPRYAIDARILPEEHRLTASGTLRLPPSNAARETIGLVLSDRMRDLQVEVLEPRESAGPATVASTPKGRSLRWTVRPPRPFPPGKAVTLRFSYQGGERLDVIFYIGPEVSFATAHGTDWYPLVDQPADRGVGTLRLTVPAGQLALAEGDRVSKAEEEARGVFGFENRRPSYFSFAAGRFHVVRREGAVPIVLYLLRDRDRANAEAFAAGVEKIIAALSVEFGRYPYRELALVEIPRELAQQAGFNAATVQGMVYVNHRAFDAPDISYLYEWLGHEISHSWFPNSVALRTPPGLFMEEALAEYGGMRAVEVLAGPAAAEEQRRTGYAPDPIYSAAAYFRLVGRGVDREIERLAPSDEDRDLAYTKGSFVWDMLSREVGLTRFRRALARITRLYAFRRLPWAELLREIEAGTGRDLGWFYQQWFGRTGAPELHLEWRQAAGTVYCTVTQPAPFYEATMELSADGEAGRRMTRRVRVRGASTSVSFRAPFPVQSVTLDPHYEVLRWAPEYRAAAQKAAPSATIPLSGGEGSP
jgi:aminopeptidase N